MFYGISFAIFLEKKKSQQVCAEVALLQGKWGAAARGGNSTHCKETGGYGVVVLASCFGWDRCQLSPTI